MDAPAGGRAGAERTSTAGEPPVITGGEGDVVFGGATTVKGSILAINGVLYVTAPDNVWALDATTAT